MTSGHLVHAIAAAEWAAVADAVRPPSLAEEGFVHLSRPDQIAWVADQRFAGREDLLLLVIDQELLPSPVVWEDCYETGQEFPHLYAPLPRGAVVDVMAWRPGPDGFEPPALPSAR